MNEPLTITCCCKSELCGMTLTVLPVAGHFKLTMTPRADMLNKEPALEWISPDMLVRRLNAAGCAFFGVFKVNHYLQEELDLDMQITEADRLQLLAMARGEQVTA